MHDVTLLSSLESAISGTLRGRNGQPIPNAFLRAATNPFFSMDTFTDAAGRYSLSVGDGSVDLSGSGAGPAAVAPPSFSFSRSGIAVAGPTTVDINLPVAQLSGRVLDPSANPVSGASVQLGSSFFDETVSTFYSSFASLTTTNPQGQDSTLLVTGSGNVTATPPAGSPFVAVSDTFTLTADQQLDLRLGATVTLSGRLRGRGLLPIPGAIVTASVGGTVVQATTNSTGNYSMLVPQGTAFLQGSGEGPAGIAPKSFSFQRFDVVVSGPTVVNIDLPVVQLSGRVLDPAGEAVVGATVEATTSFIDLSVSDFSSALVTTGANGVYSTLLIAGVGGITARPPEGASTLPVSQGLTLAGDTVLDLRLGAAVSLQGTVRGRGNAPIANATVRAVIDFTLLETSTNNDGHYQLAVPTGTLSLFVFGSGPDEVAPPSFTVERSNIVITAPTTIDVTLTTALVTGVVADSNGVPIPNVVVEAGVSSFDADTNFSASATAITGPTGAFEALVITGSGAFTVFPPPIFLSELLPQVVAGDSAGRIVLNRSDVTAPIITAGPSVVHVSDTSVTIGWTTNEASMSAVEFDFSGSGLTFAVLDDRLTTNHLVTLETLNPATLYEFRVGSTDSSNNGPAVSGIRTFTTLATLATPTTPGRDAVPPVIANLAVLSISNSSAIVQWTTDEPASSLVDVVGGGGSASGSFTRLHTVRLNGLHFPSTYTLQRGVNGSEQQPVGAEHDLVLDRDR